MTNYTKCTKKLFNKAERTVYVSVKIVLQSIKI